MSTISYRNKNAGQRDKNGKRKKPNWEYRFELAPIGGKRRRMEKSGFPRKQDAVEAATAAYAEYMSAGTVIQPSKMSYADVLDRWMEEYGMQELADETIRNYNARIRNYIKPALGSYTVTSLDTYAIQRFINQMVKDRYSRNTIVGCKGIISKSLKYAKRMRWVARNEALEVELPSWNASRKLRCKIRMPLRREQIKEIFERFPEGTPCYIPFLFGYRAGTRLGETFALCWNDIDFENNQIDINKQVQWYPERKQWRMVPPKYDSRREIDILTVLQIRMYPILMQKILIYQILIFSHARREKTFAFAQKPASFSSVRRLYKCEKEVVITWKLSRALTILKTLRRS